jgi:hypothetical protein
LFVNKPKPAQKPTSLFDRRDKDVPEVKIPTGGLWSYDDFVKRVREVGFCAGFGLFTKKIQFPNNKI